MIFNISSIQKRFAGFAGLGIATILIMGFSSDSDSMLRYHLKNTVSRIIWGDYAHERRRVEAMRQQTLEAIKDHPDREAILRANPHLTRP